MLCDCREHTLSIDAYLGTPLRELFSEPITSRNLKLVQTLSLSSLAHQTQTRKITRSLSVSNSLARGKPERRQVSESAQGNN